MSKPPSFEAYASASSGWQPLGAAPLQVLTRKWGPRIGLIVLCATLGLGLFVGAALAAQAPAPDLAVVGACLAGGLVVLIFSAWRFRAEAGRSAALYETGLELITTGKHTTLTYDKVQEVWFLVRRMQTGGLLGIAIRAIIDRMRKDKAMDERGLTIEVRVVGGNTTIKLNNLDRGVFAAYQEIIRRVNPRLLEEARQRILSNGTVTFHKITVSRDSLIFGKKTIPFTTIESIAIKNGQFSVKVTGKWFKSGQPVASIPNLYVLTELIAGLAGGTLKMDVPMGMNLASKLYV